MPSTTPQPVTTTPTQDIQHVRGYDKTEFISVTGSRLNQTRLTNVMAGSTLDARQLQARGYTNLGIALLRENPAFSIASNSPIGSQGSFGAGQTFTGLFALGDQRTLTLVDGMRMVGGATASNFGAASGSQVDVGTIPTSLTKRIDTKYGGAGAAYGSDAIAGVVNYQLDYDFDGAELNAQGNFTQKLDAPQEKIWFKAGRSFDHERGHAVVDIEYRNAGGMLYDDRRNIVGSDATVYQRAPYGTKSTYTYIPQTSPRFQQNAVTGVPLLTGQDLPSYFGKAADGIPGANGDALMFSPNGQSLVPFTYNTLTKNNNYALGGNGLSLRQFNQLYTPSDSLNLTTLGRYKITDRIHTQWQAWYERGSATSATAQGYWSTPQFDQPLSLQTFQNSSDVNGAYTLSTNNPYLSPSARTTIKNALAANGLPTDTFYMARLNQDLDGGAFKTDTQMFRFADSTNGSFDFLHRNFAWKVQAEYSKYMNTTWQPMVATQNLINALNAVTLPDGTIGCAPGYTNATAQTRNSTCAPINLFGTGQLTPAARDYVTADTYAKNTNDQLDVQADVSGTVIKLPAGQVRWDLGYEHRHESYNFNPGSFLRGEQMPDGTYHQYGNFIPIPNTAGGYGTHEGYGELDVPFVSPAMHIPLLYSLNAQANGRYIRNSVTGSYWSYMFGGAWWPTQDIGFSGNYAQSVRNPSVTELFSPLSSSYESANDPCSQEFINSGPNPATRAANCAHAGIQQPFESNIVNYTIKGLSGGNSSLQNETSKSYTASFDFSPHFVPGLDFQGSVIDVKIANEIEQLSAGDLMDACYDNASFPNAYCSTFTRNANHQVTSFQDGYTNIAKSHMRVVQGVLKYIMPLRRLHLGDNAGIVSVSGNFLHYLTNTNTYLGTTYLQTGGTGQPRTNFTGNLTYMRGPLFFQWQAIFYGKSHYALQSSQTLYADNARPSFVYFNTTIGYQITKNFNANFMMDNVTGAMPKLPGTVSLTRYYDAILGRSFELQLDAHF